MAKLEVVSAKFDGHVVHFQAMKQNGEQIALGRTFGCVPMPPPCLMCCCGDVGAWPGASPTAFRYSAGSGSFTRADGDCSGFLNIEWGKRVEGTAVGWFRCGLCGCPDENAQAWDILSNGTIAARKSRHLVLGGPAPGPARKGTTILVPAGDPRQYLFAELRSGAPQPAAMRMQRGAAQVAQPASASQMMGMQQPVVVQMAAPGIQMATPVPMAVGLVQAPSKSRW